MQTSDLANSQPASHWGVGLARRLAPFAAAAVLAIFAFLVIFLWHHESKDNAGHLGDFRTFYQAAQFAREHKDIYRAGPNSSQMYVYPPLLAFLYVPFTFLPLLWAAHASLVINAWMLLASIWFASRAMLHRLDACRPRTALLVAFLVTLLSENELRAELMMLETDALMLLMFVLAFAWIDRRPFASGMALALALNIKYLSIVALPWMVLRRRWSAVGGMVLGSIFFALLPASLLGWQENLRCLGVSLGGLLRWVGVPPEVSHAIKVHNIADDLSVSITSAIARFLGPHGVSNPGIMLITSLFGLVVLAAVWALYRSNGFTLLAWDTRDAPFPTLLPSIRLRADDRSTLAGRADLAVDGWPPSRSQVQQPFKGLVAMEWAGLAVVALCFSPDTNTRHLVLTVLVNALAAAILAGGCPPGAITPVLVAIVLILLGYIMPLGQKAQPLHGFYFRYGIPAWSLLLGYLLILRSGLSYLRELTDDLTNASPRRGPEDQSPNNVLRN